MRSPLIIAELQERLRSTLPPSRVGPAYFKDKSHWHVRIDLGRKAEEDAWLKDEAWRGRWARTRYEDHVVYLFEDQVDAMFFKMRFQ